MTKYKVSLENQQVTPIDSLEYCEPLEHRSPLKTFLTFTAGVAIGASMLAAVRSCEKYQPALQAEECRQCHYKIAMVSYFKQAGSRSPEEMANAVLNTQSPRLLAAISKIESNGNSHIRGTGYKRRHDGAFQVNSKHWGIVPKDAFSQAQQAEAILLELTATQGIEKALNAYGGDTSGKYAFAILDELQRRTP